MREIYLGLAKYVAPVAFALAGCGNEQASQLERKVEAQAVVHAAAEELDLSTPEKTLEALKMALNKKDYLALREKILYGNISDKHMEELKSVARAGEYKLNKNYGKRVRAKIQLWSHDGEFDNEGVTLELFGNQWKARF